MQISLDCPQCGGDITFDEELEVISCPYCSSAMQISGKSGRVRFMLPPRWSASECRQRIKELLGKKKSLRMEKRGLRLVYAPYWRSKGMVFHWMIGKREDFSREDGRRTWDDFKELKTKAFDLSFPAYKSASLGLESLGVRTAALRLRLYHPSRLSRKELVLPVEVDLQEAVKHSNAFLTFGFADSSLRMEVEDTQLIGETYSLVYFPFWIIEVGAGKKTGLLIIDAVANRITQTLWQQDLTSFSEKCQESGANGGVFGTLNLIPSRCPVCGWDFPLSSQSKVHVCPTCTRAWAEQHGSYSEVKYQLVDGGRDWNHPAHYLPFWELPTRIHASDGVLKTRADLRRVAPGMAIGRGAQDSSKPIHFLIPAFKINSMPSLCKLATSFCLRPPEASLRAKERLEKESFGAVYLASTEAVEMARVVLFSLLPRYNRRARLLLNDARLESQPPRLVYYPFYRKGLYLREVNSNHGIQHGTVAMSAK